MKTSQKILLLIILVLFGILCGALAWYLVRPSAPAAERPLTDRTFEQPSQSDVGQPAGETALPEPPERPDKFQIGLNFIRFYQNQSDRTAGRATPDTTTPALQPEAIFSDFEALGAQVYRQFVLADLMWNIVEPAEGEWNFTEADAVLTHSPQEPIVTLFAMQYASPTPPWDERGGPFQTTFGDDAKAYLDAVVGRYAPYVKYWEIGNEMNHWRSVDEAGSNQPGGATDKVPPSAMDVGFSPEEQGKFIADAADYIRALDPDAVIVLPGMGGLDDYTLDTWLAGVIKGGGEDAFDIVNYHFYNQWDRYALQRERLAAFLEEHGMADKPVWNTETGSTSEASLPTRTDYPNSATSQAADIFRRLIPAYGHGDAVAIWHTYIGSPVSEGNTWAGYGIMTDKAVEKPAYHSFRLLTSELIPFAEVETLSDTIPDNRYKITTESGETKYVFWGSVSAAVPEGASQMASVIPSEDGVFTWTKVAAGQKVTLTDEPILLK